MSEAAQIVELVADILICLGSAMAVVLIVWWLWHVIRQVVRLRSPN